MQPPEHAPHDATTDPVVNAAREAAERVAFAANAVPALLAYLDAEARYTWVNRRWFGRPVETIVGRHVSELLGAAGWATVRPHVERALAGEEVTFDNRLDFEGNAVHDVRVSYVPHRDASGSFRRPAPSIEPKAAWASASRWCEPW